MSKLIRLGLFVLLLVFAPHACPGSGTACPPAAEQPSPEAMQEAALNASDRGFLWRISKDGRTSFLYGTLHVAKFGWMFPGPRVMQALSSTDTVALELDIMDADIQQRMARGMTAAPGTALPESLVQRMRRQADALCIPYASISRFSPELQVTTLTAMAGRAAGLDPAYSIDGVLAGIGHGANKRMVSLETPEAQLHAADERYAANHRLRPGQSGRTGKRALGRVA